MDTLSAALLVNSVADVARRVHSTMEAQTLLCFTLIARHPDITLTDLAQRLDITLSSVSRNIARLSDEGRPGRGKGLGMVVRYEDPVDRRIKRVRLNRQGEKFWKDMSEELDQAVTRVRGK